MIASKKISDIALDFWMCGRSTCPTKSGWTACRCVASRCIAQFGRWYMGILCSDSFHAWGDVSKEAGMEETTIQPLVRTEADVFIKNQWDLLRGFFFFLLPTLKGLPLLLWYDIRVMGIYAVFLICLFPSFQAAGRKFLWSSSQELLRAARGGGGGMGWVDLGCTSWHVRPIVLWYNFGTSRHCR